MGNFWQGVFVGAIALLSIAHLVSNGQREQCESDHHVKQCELKMIPVSDSTVQQTEK